MSSPRISLVLPTARDDHALIDLPTDHIFDRMVESLDRQDFNDFELVVVDSLRDERADYFARRKPSFPVVHVPPKPNPWHARRLWAVCSQVNTGLRYVRGEVTMFLGDCCELTSDNTLRRVWELHQEGYLSQLVFRYCRGGRPLLDERGARVQDTRIPQVEAAGGIMNGSIKDWWYGYGAAPTEALLAINGYDEAFDGCKSLEDCDLGSRLEMAGYTRLRLETSTGLDVVEHGHLSISSKVMADPVNAPPKAGKCNYALYLYNREARRVRANTGPLPPEGLARVRQLSREAPCSGCGGEDYDLEEGFRWWAENVPAFDLRKERETTLRALYG